MQDTDATELRPLAGVQTTLADYRHLQSKTGSQLVCTLSTPDGAGHRLTLQSTQDIPDPKIDAFLPIGLMVASKFGGKLRIEGPVGVEAIQAASAVSRVLTLFRNDSWHDRYRRFWPTQIVAEADGSPMTGSPRFAAFYSGGVDSMFSLLEHCEDLTDLIFINNWEGEFTANDLQRIHYQTDEVGRKYSLPVTRVTFSPREALRQYVSWHFLHGSVLHSMALCHQSVFGRILIPSSYTVNELEPWGSHPLLDPLWSCNGQYVMHDRIDATRIEKMDRVLSNSFLAKRMRVCWRPAVDCGVCGKCFRTRLVSQILGKPWAANSAAQPSITPNEILSFSPRDSHDLSAFREIADYLEDANSHHDIERSIKMLMGQIS